MVIPDGKDAKPVEYPFDLDVTFSLRDLFAASALLGLVEEGLKADVAAREAYEYADAMITERSALLKAAAAQETK